MSRCDSCKYPYDIRKWPCEDCLQGDRYEAKPHTNADRIRAMTDEELAEFLQKNRGGCKALTTKSYVCDNTDCKACWLDWLKQEVEE